MARRYCGLRASTLRAGLLLVSLALTVYILGTSAYELHLKDAYRVYSYNNSNASPPILRASRGLMGMSITLTLYLIPATLLSLLRLDDAALLPLIYTGVDVGALFLASAIALGMAALALATTTQPSVKPGYNAYSYCTWAAAQAPAGLPVDPTSNHQVHQLHTSQCDLVLSTAAAAVALLLMLPAALVLVVLATHATDRGVKERWSQTLYAVERAEDAVVAAERSAMRGGARGRMETRAQAGGWAKISSPSPVKQVV